MNKIAKGKRIEREISRFFEGLGYSVFRPTWSRWGQKDVFNRFDIICVLRIPFDGYRIIRKLENLSLVPVPSIWFLQVKSNPSDFYTARKEIRRWLMDHMLGTDVVVSVGVILRIKKGEYRVWVVWGGEEHDWVIR